jgi:hypothetical protein
MSTESSFLHGCFQVWISFEAEVSCNDGWRVKACILCSLILNVLVYLWLFLYQTGDVCLGLMDYNNKLTPNWLTARDIYESIMRPWTFMLVTDSMYEKSTSKMEMKFIVWFNSKKICLCYISIFKIPDQKQYSTKLQYYTKSTAFIVTRINKYNWLCGFTSICKWNDTIQNQVSHYQWYWQ